MTITQITTLIAAIIGGLSAFIPGIYGDVFFKAVLYGSISGGVIGYWFSLQPRSFNAPRLPIESFSLAGFAGAIAGCVTADAGWFVIFISCGFGWLLGLLLVIPAAFIAVLLEKKDESFPNKNEILQTKPTSEQSATGKQQISNPNTKLEEYKFDEDLTRNNLESVAKAAGKSNDRTIQRLKQSKLNTDKNH